MASRSQLTPHQIDELIELNVQSFLEAFKADRLPLPRLLLQAAMRTPAQRITRTVLEYDASITHRGLSSASQWLLNTFLTDMYAVGDERVPRSGPLLIVSNHPGMTDAMALFASLPRQDVKIVGRSNPILRLLPGIQEHVIFVPENADGRISTLRAILRQLRAGHTVILFPAGEIEPDPALRPNAADTLADWSASFERLARHVPGLQIVPVAVGGVISQTALQNPITQLYTTPKQRDWVAATLMALFPRYRRVQVTVRYGQPIHAAVDTVGDDVRDQMRDLIAQTWQAASTANNNGDFSPHISRSHLVR